MDNKNKFKDFFMKSAFLLAEYSHCISHHVGAVIVKDNRIISMGYNGTPSGAKNCDDNFNCDSFDPIEHTKWSNMEEIHAESNALAFAVKNGLSVNECEMYVTMSPCNHCLKNLVASGIKNVYYFYKYEHSDLSNVMLSKINLIHYTNPKLGKFISDNDLVFKSSNFAK